MSAFSFTAPIISEEQEKEEYLKFAEEEREKIKSDLYGTNVASLLLEQEKLLERLPESLILLQEALDAIPQNEKVDYLQALARVPHLVERESPGRAFLQACNFDPWSAASRLVSYWKVRREAFGDDKAFQPMTLDGALKEDRHVFDLGFFALLPPDKAGRPIIFWNRIACTKAVATRDVFIRCLFYVAQVAVEEDNANRGFVFIYNARGFDLYRHFDRILMKRVAKNSFVIPITFRCMHVITGSGQSVVGLILPVMKHIVGLHQRHRLKIHAGSDFEILDHLGDYGIKPCSVPAMFSGDWKPSDFAQWREKRHKLELRATDSLHRCDWATNITRPLHCLPGQVHTMLNQLAS